MCFLTQIREFTACLNYETILSHTSYKRDIILEKCGHLGLNNFHLPTLKFLLYVLVLMPVRQYIDSTAELALKPVPILLYVLVLMPVWQYIDSTAKLALKPVRIIGALEYVV